VSLNAATIELLLSKGLTGEDLLEVARSLETTSKPRSKAAERQAAYRARQAGNVTSDVTRDVTDDVTNNVTRDVTPPPQEYISTPRPVSVETGTILAAQPKSKRGTRLADNFEPPEDWVRWAMKKRGWNRDEAVDEAECFIRYWQAKPGREACKLDWPKTWQNWVVNSRRIRTAADESRSMLC
jgi:hypothetical protein